MDAARYQELLANDGARAFPAKPYGLEPLLFLCSINVSVTKCQWHRGYA